MPAELYECEFVICLFIGCAGSSLLRAGSLVLVGGGSSPVAVCRFLVWWHLSLWSTGSRACRLQQLWPVGLAAPRHVEPSWTGIKPLAPALESGFLTTGPQGSPKCEFFNSETP